jgi:phytoene/squalene synthetase
VNSACWQRNLQPELLNLTFTDHLGKTTPTLKEYLVGPRQVQAMMMAHKGKVVFETYPGMNPLDMHVWMSASKTTVGLLVAMLANGQGRPGKAHPRLCAGAQGHRLGQGLGEEHHEHGGCAG